MIAGCLIDVSDGQGTRIGMKLGRTILYLWAGPTTLVGLIAGALTLGTRGRVQVRRGALEFHGGVPRRFLRREVLHPSALTLCPLDLGATHARLDHPPGPE